MGCSGRRGPMFVVCAVLGSALLSACSGGGKTSGVDTPSHTPTAGATATVTAGPSNSPDASQNPDAEAFARLERQYHAQLGVYVLDTGTGRIVAYQADERFAYASTAKALAAGVLLQRDTDAQLDRVITYRAADLVENSPVTSVHVADGLKLRDAMAAALEYSDNTAENLLLGQLGGPSGLQYALRSLGDATTYVQRTEPTLNQALPRDIRDTSTARALAADLSQFVLGKVLTTSHKQLLTGWLKANTTGGPYIRAGVPAGWTVADKTGNAGYGTRNDIAVVWPPGRSPLVMAILSNRGTANAASNDALIADATRAALSALA